MSDRSHIMPSIAGAIIVLVGGFGSSTARAASKETQALELAKKAIYSDYLEMRFPDAEKKLRDAIALCAPSSACTGKVRAKLRCDLGILYIGGMSRRDDGKAEFAEALKKDPAAAIDPDLVSPEIEAAFAEAKAEASAASGAATPPPSDALPADAETKSESPSDTPKGPAVGTSESGDCPPDFPGCRNPKVDEQPPCEAGADCTTPPPSN